MDPQVKREKRIRRQILQLVNAARAGGAMPGRMLADILSDLPDGLQGDEELVGLAMDLVNLGLLTATDTRKLKSQRPGLDYTAYGITAKGTALLAGAIEVEPLVEDERIG